MRWMILTCMLLTLFGCGKEVPSDNYFPLHEGLSWHYRVTETQDVQQTSRSFSITNLGQQAPVGLELDLPVYVRRSSAGTDYYIVQDDAGSYRVAKRTIVELKPQLDAVQRKILPGFRDLETGRSWQVESQPYLLRSSEFHSLPEPSQQRFILGYEITATDSTVTVPAGRFENCIEVTGQGQISLYADPRLGYQDVYITQKEWYAPGVGLVKLSREEPLDLPMFQGGGLVFELESFEH
jgi:hypothetical protein